MGSGTSHGAITILNAIPTGIGATIGVNLLTRAEFVPGGHGVSIELSRDIDTHLAETCVK